MLKCDETRGGGAYTGPYNEYLSEPLRRFRHDLTSVSQESKG